MTFGKLPNRVVREGVVHGHTTGSRESAHCDDNTAAEADLMFPDPDGLPASENQRILTLHSSFFSYNPDSAVRRLAHTHNVYLRPPGLFEY